MADLGFVGRITSYLLSGSYPSDNANRQPPLLDVTGVAVQMGFLQKALLDGRGFQVRAGTITTPLTGDGTAITDTAAEMCADAATSTTILPYYVQVGIDTWTADDSEGAIKSVGAVSTSGTAFVPLPLKQGGSAASGSSARVAQTGGVTVAAELATTTRRYASWHSDEGGTPATDVSIHTNPIVWDASLHMPILVGPSCFYVQESLATYMASLEYLEFTTAQLGL